MKNTTLSLNKPRINDNKSWPNWTSLKRLANIWLTVVRVSFARSVGRCYLVGQGVESDRTGQGVFKILKD